MINNRKALVVGINDYPDIPLSGCINDAEQIAEFLEKNYDDSRNFDVKLIRDIQKKGELLGKIKELFAGDCEVVLFYFSGHGCINELGGYIVTPDYDTDDEGIKMNDVLQLANHSRSKHKIIILDCCHSGSFGNSIINGNVSEIGNGVTVLQLKR